MKRRSLLKTLGAGLATLPVAGVLANTEPAPFIAAEADPKDEKFWNRFRKDYYDVPTGFINLEHGFFTVQAKPVVQAYVRNIEKVNLNSSRYVRTDFAHDYAKIVQDLAAFSGVTSDELLITRNAVEALNIIIQGLDLKRGDEVVLCRLDYPTVVEIFEMLAARHGIVLRYITLPLLPESDEQIIDRYREAVTPATRCVMVTHLIHYTGQILPVRKIVDAFRPRGIHVVVDAAHSYAHVDYKLSDLGADFIAVNLHKWLGAPLGVGLLFVRKERIKDLKPLFADHHKSADDINKLGHFGTLAIPVVLTISAAQQFTQTVTVPRKEARLRYMQNYWTSRAATIPRVIITTPTEAARSCAIATFRIDGVDTGLLIKTLNDRHKVFTVIRDLIDDKNQVVRVSVSLTNQRSDLDALLEGIKQLAKT